jgi:hypothetical protein
MPHQCPHCSTVIARTDNYRRHVDAHATREPDLIQPAPVAPPIAPEAPTQTDSSPADQGIEGEETSAEKIRREIARFKEGIEGYAEGEIIRIAGADYRLEGESLRHVYFPDGEKIELQEGDLFRIGEDVYWVHEGKAVRLSIGEMIETILEWEQADLDGLAEEE